MQQLPKNSKVLVDRKTIDQAINKLAKQINTDYSDKSVLFLTVMNGGMLFASELSQKLDVDMQMDYLQLSRYGKDTKGGQLIWKYQPEIELSGKHVILCDDIYDEGHTLAAAHNWCLKKGALSVASVVLVFKEHDREYANYKADYIAMTIKDHYIYGMGMDYEERLRHLPEIYYIP